jgi:putative transposase
MTYPLVRDLAAGGVPVAVTCRVLGFCRQAFYAWCADPVPQRDWDEAHLIDAALDVHRDDPGFGYRFIAGELPARGITAGENKVARLCSQQRIWSAFSKKRGLSRKAGPPVHEDLAARQFTAAGPAAPGWTTSPSTPVSEGNLYLYLCAIKDIYSNRIGRLLDGLLDDRRPGRLGAPHAIALRSPAGTVIVHSDPVSSGPPPSSARWPATA